MKGFILTHPLEPPRSPAIEQMSRTQPPPFEKWDAIWRSQGLRNSNGRCVVKNDVIKGGSRLASLQWLRVGTGAPSKPFSNFPEI